MITCVKNAENSFNTKNKTVNQSVDLIDLNDYNYPPIIKLIHYKPVELDIQKRLIANRMHVIVFLILSVNLVNSTITLK